MTAEDVLNEYEVLVLLHENLAAKAINDNDEIKESYHNGAAEAFQQAYNILMGNEI